MKEFQAGVALRRVVKKTVSYVPAGTGVFTLLKSVLKNRGLIVELVKRDLVHQHAGQIGGSVWLVAHPLILFTTYAVLFTTVFQVRVAGRGPSDYLVYLFSGLTPWLLTQDVLVRSSSSLISSGQIVKKVLFPIEALVAKSVITSISIQGILFGATLLFILIARQAVPMSFLLLPVVVVLHAILLWGMALFLSIATPYFRDLPELLRVFLTINIYLMPVTYVPSMVPGPLRFLLDVNPFGHLIWCYQDVLYFNSIEHPISWAVTLAFSGGCLAIGSYIFMNLRRYLASIL